LGSGHVAQGEGAPRQLRRKMKRQGRCAFELHYAWIRTWPHLTRCVARITTTSGCLSKGSKPFGNRVRIAAGLVNSGAEKYGGQADGGAGDRVTPRRGLATSINKPTHALAHETCRATAAFQGGTGHSRLATRHLTYPHSNTKKASRSSPFSNGMAEIRASGFCGPDGLD
jgi:hypothetical protein